MCSSPTISSLPCVPPRQNNIRKPPQTGWLFSSLGERWCEAAVPSGTPAPTLSEGVHRKRKRIALFFVGKKRAKRSRSRRGLCTKTPPPDDLPSADAPSRALPGAKVSRPSLCRFGACRRGRPPDVPTAEGNEATLHGLSGTPAPTFSEGVQSKKASPVRGGGTKCRRGC